jgi:hypothetical protein
MVAHMPVNESSKQTTESRSHVLHRVSILRKARFIRMCSLLSDFLAKPLSRQRLLDTLSVMTRSPGSCLEPLRRVHLSGRLPGYIPVEQILQYTMWPEVGRFPQHCQFYVQFTANEMTERSLCLSTILVPQWLCFRVSPHVSLQLLYLASVLAVVVMQHSQLGFRQLDPS